MDDFYSINKILYNFDNILGDSKKPVNQGEIMNMQNLGTGVYSISDIKKGKVDFESKDIEA